MGYWIPVICQVILVLFTIGAIVYKFGHSRRSEEVLIERAQKMENTVAGLEKQLVLFVDKPACAERHNEMTKAMCKKIEDLQHAIELIEEKRDTAKQINDERWERVFLSLGQLQGEAR